MQNCFKICLLPQIFRREGGLRDVLELFDPFDGAKPRLSRYGKEALFRVNPEQARVSGRESKGSRS